MVIGKFITKFVQAIPSWEMTKYYGRVCVFQLKCIKYRIQTSEAWFNFRCKFMPGSIQDRESMPEKLDPKADPCESQNRLNESNNKQGTKGILSKTKIWQLDKSNLSKDPGKSNEKKK